MTFDRFSVIVVPFPFADRDASKRRPALVLSSRSGFGAKSGHSLLAMITSAENPPWPLDVPIRDIEAAGLAHASKVRMKLFTLDERIIVGELGSLAPIDRKAVEASLRRLLAW